MERKKQVLKTMLKSSVREKLIFPFDPVNTLLNLPKWNVPTPVSMRNTYNLVTTALTFLGDRWRFSAPLYIYNMIGEEMVTQISQHEGHNTFT